MHFKSSCAKANASTLKWKVVALRPLQIAKTKPSTTGEKGCQCPLELSFIWFAFKRRAWLFQLTMKSRTIRVGFWETYETCIGIFEKDSDLGKPGAERSHRRDSFAHRCGSQRWGLQFGKTLIGESLWAKGCNESPHSLLLSSFAKRYQRANVSIEGDARGSLKQEVRGKQAFGPYDEVMQVCSEKMQHSAITTCQEDGWFLLLKKLKCINMYQRLPAGACHFARWPAYRTLAGLERLWRRPGQWHDVAVIQLLRMVALP